VGARHEPDQRGHPARFAVAALILAAAQILSAGPDSFLATILRFLTGWPMLPPGP
jgi:hypothetical protein